MTHHIYSYLFFTEFIILFIYEYLLIYSFICLCIEEEFQGFNAIKLVTDKLKLYKQ